MKQNYKESFTRKANNGTIFMSFFGVDNNDGELVKCTQENYNISILVAEGCIVAKTTFNRVTNN